MWSILTLLALAYGQTSHWISGGDLTNAADLNYNKEAVTNSRGSALAPIRIYFETSNLSGDLKTKVEAAIPKVRTYLSNVLKVYPIVGSLNLGTFNCNGTSINLGSFDADFYIKYLVRVPSCPVTEDACVTGYTASCHVHKLQKNNAVGGLADVNEFLFLKLDSYQQWTFLLHQAINLLGFSEELSKFWEKTTSGKYTELEKFNDRTNRGVNRRYVVTPTVKAESLSTWNSLGAELEEADLKFPYTRSSRKAHHWDSRFLTSDIMAQRGFHEMIVSRVTLALLKDTNWYNVDLTKGQTPIWGRAEQCRFTDIPCYQATSYTVTPRYWCFLNNQKGCDAMRTHKGLCNFGPCTYSNTAYRYFCVDGVSCAGNGGDIFTDYCAVIQGQTSGDCRLESNGRNDQNTATSKKIEVYGISSRCFEHNLVVGSNRDLELDTACLQVDCTKTPYEVILQSKVSGAYVTVQCIDAGGWVRVPEWGNGYIKCWPRTEVCGDAPCKDTCNGQGACVGSTCQCFNGYSGPDCNTPCDTKCVRCTTTECNECKPGFYLDNGVCRPCPVECPTCKAANDCTSCVGLDTLYTLVIVDGKGVCKPICRAGCKECDVPDGCITPEDGKCFDTTGGLGNCCGNCKVCSATRCCECKECKTNFFLTSIGTCTNQCAANCKICASIYDCAVCNAGFILNDDKKCIRCPPGCEVCDDVCPTTCLEEGVTVTCDQANCFDTCPSCTSAKCLKCVAGYTLEPVTSECIRNCPENCRTCTSNSVCTGCNGGFAINANNLCTPCEAGCSSCNLVAGDKTKTDCFRCYSGYYIGYRNPLDINDRDCFNCLPGCVSCTGHKSCDSCTLRWFLDVFGFRDCKRCVYGCRRCLDASLCVEVEWGFYLNTDSYSPIRCHASCATCGSDLVCTSCVAGFFFYQCTSSNCLCRYCEPNCARCSGPIECVVCRCGYYLAGVNECRPCHPTCYSCDRLERCNSCRGGYFIEAATGTCKQCACGCVHCVDYDHCRCCAGGYWPDEYVCKPCSTRCALCWTATDCYACVCGWYLDKCSDCLVPVISCKPCDMKCIRCSGLNDCYVCKSGYYLSAGLCECCGPNCAICEDNQRCTICRKGYYLSADRKCIKCEVGCYDCCDANTCLKETCGYFLENFSLPDTQNLGVRAVPCESKCRQCTGLGLCTSVAPGFWLDNGRPKACPSECGTCNNPGFCTRCISKYYLMDGACLACDANCNACDKDGCTTPKSGYYVGVCSESRRNIPYLCKSPCSTCRGEDEYDCYSCRGTFGYVRYWDPSYKSYACRPCANNCRSCTRQDTCSNCNPGYYIWTDGSVGKCGELCTACKANTASTVSAHLCTACRTGYGVKNGACIPCSANCNKCANDLCEVCANGYVVTDTGSCTKCTNNCLLCKGTTSSCTACGSGYYLTSKPTGSCLQCITKCLRCSSGSTCDCCAGGYFFDVGTSLRPASCSYCGDGCKKCGYGAGCSQVYDGFYIDYSGSLPVSKSCRAGRPYCRLCSQLQDPVTNVYSVVCSACTTSARKIPNC